jgi:proprotein convertase subtilisin/kexin type 5
MNPCPAGFTGISGICQACTNSCKTCSGATSICLTCVNGTYFQNGSCVISCGTNMFIDYVAQTCIGCTSPCNTCVNSTTTCTSCLTGFLFNSACISECPTAMFNQSSTCKACPSTCTTCSSLTNCSICLGTAYLYNGACVFTCPATSAVILNGACVGCSTSGCFSCTSGDVCTSCKSGFLYLKTLCVTNCSAGYTSNGTHCIDTLASSLTVPLSNAFPVPFSIAGAVLIIACLMSRLQFN